MTHIIRMVTMHGLRFPFAAFENFSKICKYRFLCLFPSLRSTLMAICLLQSFTLVAVMATAKFMIMLNFELAVFVLLMFKLFMIVKYSCSQKVKKNYVFRFTMK